jgi:hypothetical protein
MAARHTSNRNSDGNIIGQDATDKIGFYGTTPVVQQVVGTGATVAQLITALTTMGLIRNT